MTKPLMTKAVICVILCVCIGMSVIPNTQGTQEDQSMSLISDENSVICGYVTYYETGDPFENVYVYFHWQDSEGNQGSNWTYTDDTGFYQFNTTAVEFYLNFYHENYFEAHSNWMTIEENQILWFNTSLMLIPPQTVQFHGFISDNSTGELIDGAHISVIWDDYEGHFWENYTNSDSTGYYSIGAIPGRNLILVRQDNYFDYESEVFYTENNSVIWLNISILPFPPTSVLVQGFITDAETGDPIPYASVSIQCHHGEGYFHNSTSADEVGFYSMRTISGTLVVWASKSNYDATTSYYYEAVDNETLWFNFTMIFQPVENSEIKGYVMDSQTHGAVRNAFVRYDWKDQIGHFYSKYTFTDQKGFYSIKAPKGSVQFLITGNGYYNQQMPWFSVEDDTDYWMNTTLTPEISVVFTKPQPGIYINNESRFPLLSRILGRFFPQSKPLIIGPVEILVNVTKSSMGCDRVEFYIDSLYRGTDVQAPFTYYWNQPGFLIQKHEIQVIAYDNAGPCTIETITVWKFI
jgi:hypothetical protein